MGTVLGIVSTVNDMMENFGCVCFACQSVGKSVEIFKEVLVYRTANRLAAASDVYAIG
jgi:hypothetical protein